MREDGGTPGFLQAFRTALCVKLKEQMNGNGQYMVIREHELCQELMAGLRSIPECALLAGDHTERHGIVSFTLRDIHYNLAVQLLNDRFGIQARGGRFLCRSIRTLPSWIRVDAIRSDRRSDHERRPILQTRVDSHLPTSHYD